MAASNENIERAMREIWTTEKLLDELYNGTTLMTGKVPRRPRRERLRLRVIDARTKMARRIAPWLEDYGDDGYDPRRPYGDYED